MEYGPPANSSNRTADANATHTCVRLYHTDRSPGSGSMIGKPDALSAADASLSMDDVRPRLLPPPADEFLSRVPIDSASHRMHSRQRMQRMSLARRSLGA